MVLDPQSPATEREDTAIRDEIDQFLIADGDQSRKKSRLHIGAGEVPLCGNTSTGYNRKDTAVYPPGYREYCKDCLRRWREVRS